MKILMIGWYKPQVGGGSNVVQALVARFKREHSISVVNMEEIGRPRALGHWVDGNVDVYQERLYLPSRLTNVQTLIQTTKRALLLRNKADIYHAHGVFFSGAGWLDRSKPLVLHIHGYPSLEPITSGKIKSGSVNFRFIRWAELKSIKRADAIITVGSKLRQWVIDELGAKPEKVFHVPNGVDTDEFRTLGLSEGEKAQIKRKYGLPEGAKVLLFTKHFSPRYGIQYVIAALPHILDKYPDVCLVATNEDDYLPKIKALAKSYGGRVEDSCRFTGRLSTEELIRLYNAADAFIHPSINDQETFGIALIEAMACGLPVVATAVGGPEEILVEGRMQMGEDVGISIKPENENAIANSVAYLFEHPEEARKMAKRAREYVLKNYSWDRAAQRTLEVYEYALTKHCSSQ